jgi:hypothetical protein
LLTILLIYLEFSFRLWCWAQQYDGQHRDFRWS